MEQQIKKIIMLMEEKKLIFEKYEVITDALLEASDTLVMEDYITQRGELANKIDRLDDIIKALLQEAFGEAGRLAVSPGASREDLPGEMWQIYDSNTAIQDIVRRIRLKNVDITADYKRLRDKMEQKIKETSNMPKINRYLTNLSGPGEVNNFGSV